MKLKILMITVISLLVITSITTYLLMNPTIFKLENEDDAKWILVNGYIEDGIFNDVFGQEGYYYMGKDPLEISSYEIKYYLSHKDDPSRQRSFSSAGISSSDEIVFEYGMHSQSKGYSGISLPGKAHDYNKVYWQISYMLDDVEVIDEMALNIAKGKKPEPIRFDPSIMSKENLISEGSDPVTDLLYLGQHIDDAIAAIEKEGIKNGIKPMYLMVHLSLVWVSLETSISVIH